MTSPTPAAPLEADPRTYDVTVWDWEGNVVKKLWDATLAEVEEVEEQYANTPGTSVAVEERP